MRATRRQFLAGGGVALCTATAGCAALTGEGPTFEAETTELSEDVQEETRYTERRVEANTITREFEVAGITRSVEVTNVLAEYDRAIDLGPLGRFEAGVFSVLSTPQVELLTRTFNPVGEMSAEELARNAQDRFEAIENVEAEEELEVTVLGETTRAVRHTANAELAAAGGEEVDLYLYVSEAVEAGDDFVVTVAAHPRVFGRAEGTVRTLMAGVEREGPQE